MDNNVSDFNNNAIPTQVNVNPRSQYINQFQSNNSNQFNFNYNNNQINDNHQINDHLSFNPINYIPSQSTVPQQEQKYMPMITPRFSEQQYQPSSQQYQPSNQQYQPSGIGIDTNDMINNRIFNTDHLIQGSLVPINKHHHFSRNLFQEGTPVPQDLQAQYAANLQQHQQQQPSQNQQSINNSVQNIQQLQQQWGQQGYQNGHQFRNKTLYKDELNNRLQNLSPLSDKLYMPIDQQIQTQQHITASSQFLQNQYQNSMILSPEEQKRIAAATTRGNRRDEMNARMSQYEPLSSVMTTDKKQNIGGYQPPMPTL